MSQSRAIINRNKFAIKAQNEVKLWGGRFDGKVDPLMEKFNNSLWLDKRFYKEDIQGSMVYAKALAKAGILTKEEADKLCEGLQKVEQEWQNDNFTIKNGDEDIHTANERRLTEIVGSVGAKLHTGRSRNDQVTTDVRLYLYKELKQIKELHKQLIGVACEVASQAEATIMPGYTHLQPAQPILFGHWLMSHAAAWVRDLERLVDFMPRVATLPLGSGALAGHPYGIDRQYLADELGFVNGPTLNSMDSVSDRDYVIETIFQGSLLITHLSRFAEDLIIYSNPLLGYVSMSDAYATGSSLMPQKKNPDALELLRGKAGKMQGFLMGSMAIIKGIPTTYNKDLQEIWSFLFDSVDTIKDCLQISQGVVATMKLNKEKMIKGLSEDMLATDLADYLVRKGVPFRSAHHVSGEAIKMAEQKNVGLFSLTLEDLKSINDQFEEDVLQTWNYENSANMRSSIGGTSLSAVKQQISKVKEIITNI